MLKRKSALYSGKHRTKPLKNCQLFQAILIAISKPSAKLYGMIIAVIVLSKPSSMLCLVFLCIAVVFNNPHLKNISYLCHSLDMKLYLQFIMVHRLIPLKWVIHCQRYQNQDFCVYRWHLSLANTGVTAKTFVLHLY